jgi:putative pyruvate formate lyase activating enzyme
MLWDAALNRYLKVVAGDASPRRSDCDLSAMAAAAMSLLSSCSLCEWQCEADRSAGETGTCEVGAHMAVSSVFDHYGEEPFFVPSLTVFFRSCNFECQFCQNWDISSRSAQSSAVTMTPDELSALIDSRAHCKNVNFVGGEPTPYLPFILQTLDRVRAPIPVVWNSNFYMSEAAMGLLSGVVDVYLSDFKYGNDACAERLSKITGYSATIRRNHLTAAADAELVIRHLMLPNHIDCCTRPILEFIADRLGTGVVVNLMDQYRPTFRAGEHMDIDRRITPSEFDRARELAKRLGLTYIV